MSFFASTVRRHLFKDRSIAPARSETTFTMHPDIAPVYTRMANVIGLIVAVGFAILVPRALAQAPVINSQPASSVVTVGQNATFNVAATAAGTLTYQWRRSGVPIAGATSANYSIPAASRADADFYDVVVSNGPAAATSQSARLMVAPASYPLGLRADPSFAHAYETRAPTVRSGCDSVRRKIPRGRRFQQRRSGASKPAGAVSRQRYP